MFETWGKSLLLSLLMATVNIKSKQYKKYLAITSKVLKTFSLVCSYE